MMRSLKQFLIGWGIACGGRQQDRAQRLINAVQHGHTQTVEALFRGLNVEQRLALLGQDDDENWTVLMHAAYYDRTPTVETLLWSLNTEQKLTLLLAQTHDDHTVLILAAFASNLNHCDAATSQPLTLIAFGGPSPAGV